MSSATSEQHPQERVRLERRHADRSRAVTLSEERRAALAKVHAPDGQPLGLCAKLVLEAADQRTESARDAANAAAQALEAFDNECPQEVVA